jgi:hypothetical protein
MLSAWKRLVWTMINNRINSPRLKAHDSRPRFGACLIVWGLAAVLLAAPSGCRKIGEMLCRPPSGEAVHESVPARAYTYKMSMVFHTGPEELMDYFGRDLSWLEKGSSALEVNVDALEAHTDMTEVGRSVEYTFRILTFDLPCRMICLKYRPERELWWLMNIPRAGWILLRFNIRPDPAGCRLNIDVLGQINENMRPVLDNTRFMTALCARADQVMTLVQAEFDPGLDVGEALSHGLRGELAETLLLGHRAEVWVDASPEEVKDWVVQPENLSRILEEFEIEDKYYVDFHDSTPGEVIYAPSVFDAGILKTGVETFSLRMEDYIRVNMVAFGSIAYVHAEVSPERGGTRLSMMFVGEIPGGGSAEVMNMMVYAGGIPQVLQEKVLLIKRGAEIRG